MDSNNTAEKSFIRDIRHSLLQFVQRNREYPPLLRFITDCQHVTDSQESFPDEQIRLHNTEFKYPLQVNNTLYTQLRIHSTCSCHTQHLECPRLRLDPGHDKGNDADISFNVLFASGPTSSRTNNHQLRWKGVNILVDRYGQEDL
jgi:hypothetical protein